MRLSVRDPNNENLHTWQDFIYLAISPLTVFTYIFYAVAMVIKHRVEGTVLYWPLFICIGIPFLSVDVLYNAIAGSLFFLELPREWLFTQRLIRHKQYGSEFAFELCDKLNRWDEGHC